jgi:hypothetical protein
VGPDPPLLQYKETENHDVYGKARDLVVPAATVEKKQMPGMKDRLAALNKAVDCLDWKRPELKIIPYHASVMSACIGPTIFTYARGTAQVRATIPRGGPPNGVYLLTTGTKAGDPIEAFSTGRLDHTLAMDDPKDDSEVTSYGAVYALVSSDSAIREVLTDKGLIKKLRALVQVLINFIRVFTPAKGTAKILDWFLSRGTLIEQSSGYDIELSLNKKNTFQGGTKSSVAILVDDDAQVALKQVERGSFFVVKFEDDATRKDESVSFKSNATSKAKATGVNGDAISAVGNMWAYVTLLCCESDDGEPDRKISYAFDNGTFNLAELNDPKTEDRLPRLKEHNRVSKDFIEKFEAGVLVAQMLVKKGKCKEAKETLKALHLRLGKILIPKENAPGDDKPKKGNRR